MNRQFHGHSGFDMAPVIEGDEAQKQFIAAVAALFNDWVDPDYFEVRAGAAWERNGYMTGGDLSPVVSPAPPYRLDNQDEYVLVQVSVAMPRYMLNTSQTALLDTAVADQIDRSEAALHAKEDAEIAALRQKVAEDEAAIAALEARAAARKKK